MNPLIVAMIRASGRAWWQARYSDDKVLNEWDTIPGKVVYRNGRKVNLAPLFPVPGGNNSRWEEVPKKGMVGLRLLCPNGMAAELEAPEGFRLFQFKVTYFDILMFGGGFGSGGSLRTQTAHVIGVVQDADGNCLCRAWEIAPQSKMELQALQLRLADYMVGNQKNNEEVITRLNLQIAQHRYFWHLIRFEDNINDMKFEHMGKLKLDVQGLRV